MIINVTQEHIKKGNRSLCTECPIALAINEALSINHAWVGMEEIRIDNWDTRLPDEADIFISAFDRNVPVEPFSLELDYQP